MKKYWLPRVLGIATAAYGAAITAKPALLLGPSGMLRGTEPEPEQATFVRTLGIRDLASGLAMAFAPSRKALRTAIAVRVASDAGDLVVLGQALRGKPERTKVMTIAGGWGALCALSAITTRRRR
ncbi:MAG: hypothetical protein GEV28_17860 [Actinophytocola sp.]|uniref:hypothetical protein n=1 Tax=Actinophytocola sp. TaxID=1872138 RepID=UPI0013215DBE|nr:hypothetical protein [Actinophytocola sp.]MPZ82155.1 hypothetical protein [Actinophytocola sp.]